MQLFRTQFIGNTDRYAPTNVPSGEVAVATSGSLGVLDVTKVLGTIIGDSYVTRENQRLTEYAKAWNYYTGRHFVAEWDGSIKKVPINFCSRIVRKRASWAVGKKLSLIPTKGNEEVAEVLQYLWIRNNLRSLLRRTVKTMHITGDAFWYIRPIDVKNGQQVPIEKQNIAVNLINPQYCFPIWSEHDPENLAGMVMQFPVFIKQSGVPRRAIYSAHFTPDTITYYLDHTKEKVVKNLAGVVPFVHFANNRTTDNQYGVSELTSIGEMNEDYNGMYHSVRRIVHYHGEPTTVVFGARLADMEKGADKVWSNLPKEARVEHLQLQISDVSGIFKVLDGLEDQMYREGRTPPIAYDSKNYSVANASGLAMSLLFQPLVEASVEDQEILTHGLNSANAIIGEYFRTYFNYPLEQLADEPEHTFEFCYAFKSMIPTDETAEIDNALKMHAAGVWSTAELVRRFGDVHDTRKLAYEIASDRLAAIADVANKNRALNNQPINPAGLMQGSQFVNEDLVEEVSNLEGLEDSAE
jgi:hypothetical protein